MMSRRESPVVHKDRTADSLVVTRRDAIVIARLNRPSKRNALSSQLISQITALCADLRKDREVHVLVVTGTDPAFCAGLDLAELGQTGLNLEPAFLVELRALPQVKIGAINGPAVTAGFEIALACDILLASERAAFADTHIKVGLVAGGGLSVLLPRIIGPGRAKELSLTGRFLHAPEALAWGLVNRVVPHDSLMVEAISLGQEITSHDPELLHEIEDLIDDGLELPLDQALEHERERSAEFYDRFEHAAVSRRMDGILKWGRSNLRRGG
jgi:enoyl-CoA hydratase